MDKLDSKVNVVNHRLKKTLKKMRSPGKLCIDITLFMILAVLIGVLIWVIQYYRKLTDEM